MKSKVRERFARALPADHRRCASASTSGSARRRRFDAFTFIFEQNEHGIFQVHAYPFDEAHEHVHRRVRRGHVRAAGLDTASDRGERRLPREALRQVTSTASSSPEQVDAGSTSRRSRTSAGATDDEGSALAVLGDAAHTAHFSIGSGTKLAMEDAIALAKAIVAEHDDMPDGARRLRGRAEGRSSARIAEAPRRTASSSSRT